MGLLIVYLVAARHDRRAALAGLALVAAGFVVLLFTDPLLDLGAAFILPLCAGVWWAGRLVRSRERVAAELAERSQRLARMRGDTARLAVEVDRAAIAADLDAENADDINASYFVVTAVILVGGVTLNRFGARLRERRTRAAAG